MAIALFLVGLNFMCHFARIFNLACLSCIPARMGDMSSLSSATGLGLVGELLLAASVCVYSSDKKHDRLQHTPPTRGESYFFHYFYVFSFCMCVCKPELIMFGFSISSLHAIAPIAGLRGVVVVWLISGLLYAMTYMNNAHTLSLIHI
eukprot:TRINITY_DN51519_c0_g1_i1.p1 TRINITY_DN51519_c0_g1~~TRINITY_DN51519_c0_g1_i1.p1  ORF type:complete len:148 (-),score=30.43 TRINITY_DN51519_c0_g1_i1:101-544(-)